MKRCWCTCWLCPGCHGGGTGGAGGEAAFKGRGKHTPAICFLWQRHGHENLWCLASPHQCEGPGKDPGKRPLCTSLSLSQNGTGTLKHSHCGAKGHSEWHHRAAKHTSGVHEYKIQKFGLLLHHDTGRGLNPLHAGCARQWPLAGAASAAAVSPGDQSPSLL